MKCPVCYNKDTKVINSRANADGFCVRRRRECLKCGFRFSTFEEMEILDLFVIKNNGRKEIYNREKLIKGLEIATKKREKAKEKVKKIVHLVERDVQKIGENEIKSHKIGEVVMKYLKKIDKVAYIRFASVYRSFEDMKTFKKELNKL